MKKNMKSGNKEVTNLKNEEVTEINSSIEMDAEASSMEVITESKSEGFKDKAMKVGKSILSHGASFLGGMILGASIFGGDDCTCDLEDEDYEEYDEDEDEDEEEETE